MHLFFTFILEWPSFDNIARSREKKRRKERNETVNWANSLSRQCSSVLFFSSYSPCSRGFLVCPIVPSHTHSRPRRRGRFISYLLNFIKHPGRQHGRIFHFLVSKGTAQRRRVPRKMENARRWLRRATLSSFSYSPVPACTYKVPLFLPSSVPRAWVRCHQPADLFYI